MKLIKKILAIAFVASISMTGINAMDDARKVRIDDLFSRFLEADMTTRETFQVHISCSESGLKVYESVAKRCKTSINVIWLYCQIYRLDPTAFDGIERQEWVSFLDGLANLEERITLFVGRIDT